MSEYANVLQSVAFHGGCETLNPNSLRNMGISMFLLLFVLWVIFNGKVTVEIVLFGLAFAVLLFAFLCRFMDYSIAKEKKTYRNLFAGLVYIIMLVIEIVKANGMVMRLIVSPKYEVEPKLIKFRTKLKGEAAKVVLANSITLTPGTITVSLDGDEYLVHCLDKELGEGIENSCFVKKLEKMEGKEEGKK